MNNNYKKKYLIPINYIAIIYIIFLLFVNEAESNALTSISDITFLTSQYKDEYLNRCDANMANIKNPSNLNYINCPCIPLISKPNTNDIVCIAPWVGNYFDIWIIKKDKATKKWSKPFFTGEQLLYIKDYEDKATNGGLHSNIVRLRINISKVQVIETNDKYKIILNCKYGKTHKREINKEININKKQLLKDTDEDGLTDTLENRLRTNIFKTDTDEDGIQDSKDNDPTISDKIINPYINVINECYKTGLIKKEKGDHTPYLIYFIYKDMPSYPVNINHYVVHIINRPINSYNSMLLKVEYEDGVKQRVKCSVENLVYAEYGLSGYIIYYDVIIKSGIFEITNIQYGPIY